MKGMVFTEFLDMVEGAYSADVVDDIIDDSGVASGGAYTAVGTYDAAEMTALVQALSDRVGIPVPDLLKAYGRYLFGRFHEMYPEFFVGVGDAFAFLGQIETIIHTEVRKLYPDAELPRFDISATGPGRMAMAYRSPRHLADLAEGLIEGTLDFFHESATVHREGEDVDGSVVRFAVTRTGG